MKFCGNCGTGWDDTAKVCGNCGTPLAQVTAPSQPAAPTAVQAPPQVQAPVYAPVQAPAAAAKKGLGVKLVAIIAAAAVVVGVVVTGFLTGWFGGSGGPMEEIMEAAVDAVESGSFKITATYKRNGGSSDSSSREEIIVAIDPDEELFYCEYDDSTDRTLCTADGIWELRYDDTGSVSNAYYADRENGTRMIDLIMLAQEALTSNDDEALADVLDMFMEVLFARGANSFVDTDEAVAFLREFESEYLSDEAWLEEMLGLEETDNGYKFKINLRKVLKEVLNSAEESDFMDGESLYALEAMLSFINFEIDLEVEIDDGDRLLVDLSWTQGIYSEGFEIEISEFGEHDLDGDDIDRIKDEVAAYEREHTCPSCGETSYDNGRCWNCNYGYSNDEYYW